MNTQVIWKWDEAAAQQYKEMNQGPDKNEGDIQDMDFQRLVTENILAKNGYGSIILKVDNTKNVEAVGEIIKKKGYGATTAQDMLDEIGKVFTALGIFSGAIGGIALFVAAIGIINTMIMATYERTREIGVMRACGATKATIRRLFTFEAALLGFFGGVIGLIVSFLLAKVINLITDRIALSQNLPISNFVTFPIWLILGVIAFTTLVGLLAGLYPAHRAAKLNPVDALRYE
jgi:putative ABC transport system permease protein